VVDGGSLENCWAGNRPVGSNPTFSAMVFERTPVSKDSKYKMLTGVLWKVGRMAIAAVPKTAVIRDVKVRVPHLPQKSSEMGYHHLIYASK
jgi:hypothetical protein